jgi:hypothetical protein
MVGGFYRLKILFISIGLGGCDSRFQIPDSPPAGAQGQSAGGQADSRLFTMCLFSKVFMNLVTLGFQIPEDRKIGR